MRTPTGVEHRAAVHAALGDPARLALVEELALSDRAPVELCRLLDIGSNLLAHHLDVLEGVGLIERTRSSGDARRRYVRLVPDALADLTPGRNVAAGPALFVCTANSARSQLAAALWSDMTGEPSDSAGTEPAERVHPGAVAAARRAGLDLSDARPRALSPDEALPPLVITVCDQAHEAAAGDPAWLHWSVPDPVPSATRSAFDHTVGDLRRRIRAALDAGPVAS